MEEGKNWIKWRKKIVLYLPSLPVCLDCGCGDDGDDGDSDDGGDDSGEGNEN